jgi:hypothetical protein
VSTPTGRWRLEPVVIGGLWLAAIALNVALVPSNEQLAETFGLIGLTGQVVAVAVVGGYIALSGVAILFVSRAAPRTRLKRTQDELFLFAAIGAASIGPWSLIALMRDVGPLSSPFVNPLWVWVPSGVALVAALAIFAASRMRSGGDL